MDRDPSLVGSFALSDLAEEAKGMFQSKDHRVKAVEIVSAFRRSDSPILIRADDDCFYWVKANSSRPSAAHEAAAWCAASMIGLSTPSPALVDLSAFPCALQRLGADPTSEYAYGARLHGDGSRTYDFLPKGCIEWVENLQEIVQWTAFDVWVGNGEDAQPVFSRAASIERTPRSLRALKISHARCFDGFAEGDFARRPNREFDRYQKAAESFDLTQTVQTIRSLSTKQLRTALDHAPTELLDHSYRELLLEGLLARQAQLSNLVDSCVAQSLSVGRGIS